MNIGDRIRDLRRKRNLSQDELGELLVMGRTNIANYENGRIVPPTEALLKIADVFKVSVDFLLGRVENPYDTYKTDSNLTSEQEKNLAAFLSESEMMLRDNAGVDEEALNEVLRYMKFTFIEKMKQKDKNK